jgi:phosphoribosyl-ATP pyrophosphohydrolase/phosphoribosyl-AMP cyclohydrolase
MTESNIDFLLTLEQVIRQRIEDRPDSSYTAKLVAQGNKRVAQKVGEEAIELALATTDGDRDEQLAETADLVYHLLVLLVSNGITLGDVNEILRQRHASA